MGKATVQRAYKELVEHGFLVLEKEGNWYHRKAHEWRLTTKSMQRARGVQIPTHDWRNYRVPEKENRGAEMEPWGRLMVPCENPNGAAGSKSKPVRRKHP